jgi:hypothetical protein
MKMSMVWVIESQCSLKAISVVAIHLREEDFIGFINVVAAL